MENESACLVMFMIVFFSFKNANVMLLCTYVVYFSVQVVRHGGCLGLGLAAMGTASEGTYVCVRVCVRACIASAFVCMVYCF